MRPVFGDITVSRFLLVEPKCQLLENTHSSHIQDFSPSYEAPVNASRKSISCLLFGLTQNVIYNITYSQDSLQIGDVVQKESNHQAKQLIRV